jgi:excisionase family DNA binding protein
MSDPLLLTVPQVAKALSLSRSTVYDLIASGDLAAVKIGGARRIPAAAVQALVDRLVAAA